MAQETSVLPLPLPQELLREIEGWLDPLTLYLHKKLGPIDQNEYRELIAGAFLTDNLSAIKQLQARLDEVTFYYIQDKNSFSLSFEPLFIVSEEMEALVQTIGMPQQSYMKDRLYLLEKDPQRIIDLVIKNLGIYWMHKVSVWFTDQAARFILPSVLALEKLTPNHRIPCHCSAKWKLYHV
ncbi:hypothetical protein BDR26DRAFT_679212 [Obelidium mucronatum]|nr:hypothetical protein BDR26DRAFT_679212 [Obelidium mucronatum]